jgi:hypothetical protein
LRFLTLLPLAPTPLRGFSATPTPFFAPYESRAQAFTLQSWKTVKKPKEFLTSKAANRRFDEPTVRGYIKRRFLFLSCARTEGSFVVSFSSKRLDFEEILAFKK